MRGDNDMDKSPESQDGGPKRRSRSSSNSNSMKSRSSYSRSRSRSSEIDGFRLHIADIGDEVRKSDLEKVFAPFGELKEVWMTNSTPCFGFAVFKDKKAASAAMKAVDGVEVAGSRIRVSHARPRTRGSGRRFFNTNMRCYQCGYSGHFYRDCPELNGGGGGGGGGDKRDRESRYDSHYDRSSSRRHRDRSDREYYNDRDYGRSRHQRSSRRYDDYRSQRSSGRRHRY